MKFDIKDVTFEYTRGTGPGGQHKNKTNSCVVATHVPTGIQARVDGRKQGSNKKKAIKELERRVNEMVDQKAADYKKQQRDERIKDQTTRRTYDFSRGEVKDHVSGKRASIKQILGKARLDLMWGDDGYSD